jgi:hypothetical protein
MPMYGMFGEGVRGYGVGQPSTRGSGAQGAVLLSFVVFCCPSYTLEWVEGMLPHIGHSEIAHASIEISVGDTESGNA